MKKIVVFGGGTGLSVLLSGLKLFPLDVTTVIAVSDNGSSTGQLKNELNIPAVGDVGKVLLSMANADDDFRELLAYRFRKAGSLYNHPIRNILLAALIDLKGNLAEATKYMCRILDVKGTILPLTSEKVDLIGNTPDGTYFGEEAVSSHMPSIERLAYDHDIHINEEIGEKIEAADLIAFSPGSLYTSIIPHLLAREIRETLGRTRAPIMYVSNLVTQSGETENYTVGDHVRMLNKYLSPRQVDIVVANSGEIDPGVAAHYYSAERKEIVRLDEEAVREMGADVISGDVLEIREGKILHNPLKTAYTIFSYLMDAPGTDYSD